MCPISKQVVLYRRRSAGLNIAVTMLTVYFRNQYPRHDEAQFTGKELNNNLYFYASFEEQLARYYIYTKA